VITYARIFYEGVRTDFTIFTDLGTCSQVGVGEDDSIRADSDFWFDCDRLRRMKGHSRQHPLLIDALLQGRFGLCQVNAGVDPNAL
jgi:hypothetical protein